MPLGQRPNADSRPLYVGSTVQEPGSNSPKLYSALNFERKKQNRKD